MMIDPAATNLIFALSSLIAAATGLAGVIQNIIISYHARMEAAASKERGGAIASQIAQVDVKVDAVAEQTNGHMTALIAHVAPVDPALATAAAVKIVQTAEKVAEQLKEGACKKSETKP